MCPRFGRLLYYHHSHFICYRTCYENGQDGDCIASINMNLSDGEIPIDVYAEDPMYTAMKFSSPNYRQDDGIGNYRKCNICRYYRCTQQSF